MFYSIKKGRNKIIHSADCFHIMNSDISGIVCFENILDAHKQGYRLCKHCDFLHKQYRLEYEKIMDYCRKNGLSVILNARNIYIDSIKSQWKIIVGNSNEMFLYHKNTFESPRDSKSMLKDYHFQGDIHCESILKYLEYIVAHDYYRMLNPVRFPKKQKGNMIPQKGTKNYRKLQKRKERTERKQAINNVICLINAISATSVRTD